MPKAQRKHVRQRKTPAARGPVLVLAVLVCVLTFLIYKNATVRDPAPASASADGGSAASETTEASSAPGS